jgi:hypothetical protein
MNTRERSQKLGCSCLHESFVHIIFASSRFANKEKYILVIPQGYHSLNSICSLLGSYGN